MKEAVRDRIDAEKETKKALDDLNIKIETMNTRVKRIEDKLKLE